LIKLKLENLTDDGFEFIQKPYFMDCVCICGFEAWGIPWELSVSISHGKDREGFVRQNLNGYVRGLNGCAEWIGLNRGRFMQAAMNSGVLAGVAPGQFFGSLVSAKAEVDVNAFGDEYCFDIILYADGDSIISEVELFLRADGRGKYIESAGLGLGE
jgi:hypothetical protein